jgi:alpha-amylase/alpha-mannosidase (GH57 family)
MPEIRLVLLWHMHQPFYKDLASGEYRLPWVRLHALKDYYGMVKLLEEFPQVHATFNLVPSLVTQIEDYAAGRARDPFLEVAAKPAADLTSPERLFALQYLFQANPENMIARSPRYQQLWEKLKSYPTAEKAEPHFSDADFTDLQVHSQLAWFDEFFLQYPEVAALAQKDQEYSLEDQRYVIGTQRYLLGKVLPAYADAAKRGAIEISTSPFYHPILPLLCDSNQGRVSSPGLPLPHQRFRHPEDARAQLERGMELHERVFGTRPLGAWPSEGSVSDDVLRIAHDLGLRWMATDESVLGRTLNFDFHRDGAGRLPPDAAEKLYRVYRYERGDSPIHLIFRDHVLSDLIGFTYSRMDAKRAAEHFMQNIRESAKTVMDKGAEATVSVILDGENAWEHYPRSGREFLRRVYDAIQRSPEMRSLTVSEAIAAEKSPTPLPDLVPGSWINANFNVWIGAPEDNRSWDYLAAARETYAERSGKVDPAQRELALEEIFIAEGSDWNWWYGPEHHSANDREFDELYRRHLANAYRALGTEAPAYLSQPIASELAIQTYFIPQTAFIHPAISGGTYRYFDWMGAAAHLADGRESAMHGKDFLLKSIYAGVDAQRFYARVDFARDISAEHLQLSGFVESWESGAPAAHNSLHLVVEINDAKIAAWRLEDFPSSSTNGDSPGTSASGNVEVNLANGQALAFSVSLARLSAAPGSRLQLRFSIERAGAPVDSLPASGWMELAVASEEELGAAAFSK